MKTKRNLSMLTVVMMLCVMLFCPAVPVTAAEKCTSVEQAAVIVREAMENREAEVDITYPVAREHLTEGEIMALVQEIYNEAIRHTGVGTQGDYLYFHESELRYGYGYSDDGLSPSVDCTLSFQLIYYTTAAQEAQLGTKVNEVLASLSLNGKSDYEKVKAIYDYICENVVYDHTNLDNKAYTLKYSAYAALINGTSVCQGYANLFYRMANAAGLDTRIISGTSKGQGHAWNIVKIDGKYYNLDSTWDAGRSQYSYFLKGTGDFAEHTPDLNHPTDGVTYPISATNYPIPVPERPTEAPTTAPRPTEAPTEEPTEAPTTAPRPTEAPTTAPRPTEAPTEEPTEATTQRPTQRPTEAATEEPTESPTTAPRPTEAPTKETTTEAGNTEPSTQKPTKEPTTEDHPTEGETEGTTEVTEEEPTAEETPEEPTTEALEEESTEEASAEESTEESTAEMTEEEPTTESFEELTTEAPATESEPTEPVEESTAEDPETNTTGNDSDAIIYIAAGVVAAAGAAIVVGVVIYKKKMNHA